MEPEQATVCWPGQARARACTAKLPLYTWACDPESEWEAGLRVLIPLLSMCLLFPETVSGGAGVPKAVGRLEEEHISPSPPGIPWRQGEPPLVRS